MTGSSPHPPLLSRNHWIGWSLRAGPLCIIAGLLVSSILGSILQEQNTALEEMVKNRRDLLIAAALIAPFFETFIGQWLPLWLCGLVTSRASLRVLFSTLCFSALHLGNSLANAFTVLLVAGPVFAFTFLRFRPESRWRAYAATTLTHLLNNFFVVIILLVSP